MGMLSALVFSIIIRFTATLTEYASLGLGMFEGALSDASERARWVLYVGLTIVGTLLLWFSYRRIFSSLILFAQAVGFAGLAFNLLIYPFLWHDYDEIFWGLLAFGVGFGALSV